MEDEIRHLKDSNWFQRGLSVASSPAFVASQNNRVNKNEECGGFVG